jgi:hypothetical protein
MAKNFWQGLLVTICGCAIAIILVSLVFEIGWVDKERILVLGYGGIASIVVIYVKANSLLKKKELEDIEIKIDKKADKLTIDKIDCQIQTINKSLDHHTQAVEEMHATLENFFGTMAFKKAKK